MKKKVGPPALRREKSAWAHQGSRNKYSILVVQEAHNREVLYYADTPDETLVQLVHRRCMTITTGRISEGARCMTKVWVHLENHFNGQRLCLDRFLVRLATEFRSETVPRNIVRTVSVIPRNKVLIPRFTEESIPKLGMERNYMEKNQFNKKNLLQQTELRAQQPEFRRNKTSVPSIPSSAEQFFV